MSTAAAVQIADAVVEALNGGAFGEDFTAERGYRPAFDLKDMKDLKLTVVPKAVEMTTAGRGLAQADVQIDVGVQKKLATGANAEIDGLMALVEEIAAYVRATGRFGEASWVKTENAPIYSQEHLAELRQFTSVLTLTFRVMQ